MHLREWRRTPANLCVMTLVLGTAMGCSSAEPYNQPIFPFMKGYASARHAGAPMLLGNDSWWTRFNDTGFDRLVSVGLAENLTLAAARERVNEASADLGSIPGAASLTPSLAVQTGGAVSGGATTTSQATGTFSWLLDPYGGRREQLKSAGAQVEVADAEVNAAQLLVLMKLSNAYVDLRYQQRILALRSQDLAARRSTLAMTQRLFDANSSTRLDVARSQAVVAEIEAQVPSVKAAITAKANEIAVLLGHAPGSLPADLASNLSNGTGQPRPKLSADIGIPADLLRNRPDIRIAERRYYAAVANIGAARAALYPKLSLAGAITLASSRGTSNTDYYFGPTLELPPLLSKSGHAVVDANQSRARQAYTAWKSTVLQAILEVDSALAEYSAASRSVAAAEKTVRLYRELVDLTKELIAKDGATLSDLIDAEASMANANISLANALRVQASSFVTLNISLGSGNSYKAH